jgi:hypothetical protein
MSVLLAAAIAVVTTIPTIDQDQLQGSFEARLDRSPYINLSVVTEGSGLSNWGQFIEDIPTDDLTTARLVKMIEHGVDAAFVKGMADLGFRRLRSSELINARDHGVTPVYIASMQKFGYRLSLAEYVLAKDQGIDFRRQALERSGRRT